MVADSTRLRLGVLAIVAVSLFATLLGRLWYLQALAAPELSLEAQRKQERVVVLPPQRGRILDVKGRELVANVKSVQVVVDREVIADDDVRAALWERLGPVIGKAPAEMEARFESPRYDPVLPVPVADGIDEPMAIAIQERQEDFPGVEVQVSSVRAYRYGSIGAHVVGYLGAIPEGEVDARRSQTCPQTWGAVPVEGLELRTCRYQLSEKVGVAGIEKFFEDDLRGVPGYRKLEVDARGRVLRVLEEQPPLPGHDIQLTIDIDAQRLAERSLEQGILYARSRTRTEVRLGVERTLLFSAPSGAVVVTDHATGAVVAMASYPTFDPRVFVAGISGPDFAARFGDSQLAPLLNRAVQGVYAAGSTFKVVSALAGVTSGLRAPYTPYVDEPCYTAPRSQDQKQFCSPASDTITVDLPRAIALSRDAYFYSIGAEIWLGDAPQGGVEALQDAAATFGFGETTGVQLPFESSGRMPSPAVKAALKASAPAAYDSGDWYTADNVLTAIGQGLTGVTPLQLNNAYAAIANGGILHSPNIVARVLEAGTDTVVREFAPRELSGITFPPGFREAAVEGLAGAVRDPGGTAFAVFATWPDELPPVFGKTGTAQDVTELSENDTSLFSGFVDAPGARWSATAIVEKAGFGSETAAPIVRAVLQGMLTPGGIPPAPVAPPLGQPQEDPPPAEPLPGSPARGSTDRAD